jgi:hypothetical protein
MAMKGRGDTTSGVVEGWILRDQWLPCNPTHQIVTCRATNKHAINTANPFRADPPAF